MVAGLSKSILDQLRMKQSACSLGAVAVAKKKHAEAVSRLRYQQGGHREVDEWV